MTLFRTVEPGAEPVTLVEAKAHLRLDQTGEDALLTGLVRAARQEVERATGLAMINQAWRLVLDCWPESGTVLLVRHPVMEVISVTAYGADGEAALVTAGSYQVDSLSRPARIHFTDKPDALRVMNGIEIDFIAGFGEAGTDVPDLLKRAMLLLIAHWYELRGAVSAESQPASYPPGYERLIGGYVARRL
ncbi:hypothetical protein GA830_11020 [Mesorhizobium sp. NBSH29]|uniref:head-tail connector protein n=1 Tax=Mesorhizobium sp. NBSH29 TaxID=2654249 RepID=UPI0018964C63|nr:head-tail connector protein [Mesorhizobium sp. NBSH29]QPC87212.1 hypothetical protein GA830_11020 [Mesorhizobium sp. NBSH29]